MDARSRALALLLSIAVAACGGSSRDASPGPEPTPSPAGEAMPTPPLVRAGNLDRSFGAGGLAIVPIGTRLVNVRRRGLFVSADGRTSLFAFASDDGALTYELLRIDLPADGRGESATISRPLPSLNKVVVAFARDGSAIVLGERADDPGQIIATRLTPAGGVDTKFGQAGFAATGLASARYVLPLDDGRTVALGARNNETVLLRLAADGSTDRSFGRDGFALLPRPPGTDGEDQFAPTDIGVTPDGRLILAVSYLASTSVSPRLVALTSMGELDRTFGDDGIVGYPYLGSGGLVLADRDDGVSWLIGARIALVRGSDGKVTVGDVGETIYGAGFYALDGTDDGHRVLAGYARVPDEPRRFDCQQSSDGTCLRDAISLQSIAVDGVLDIGFGEGGTTVTDVPAPYGASGTGADAIVAAPAGRLTVAGSACRPFDCDLAVLRYGAP